MSADQLSARRLSQLVLVTLALVALQVSVSHGELESQLANQRLLARRQPTQVHAHHIKRTHRAHQHHRLVQNRSGAHLDDWWPALAKTETDTEESAETKRRAIVKYKRQALELAVNRLQILESLDEQLRNFVEAIGRLEPDESPPICTLELDFVERRVPECLADGELRRRVPPFMLNLYGQLMGAANSQSEAVRLMPYRSLVMLSFQQPDPQGHNGLELLVQLSVQKAKPQPEAQLSVRPEPKAQVELQFQGAEPAINGRHQWQDRLPSACRPSERLLPAHKRRQLCYSFHLNDQTRLKINGSLGDSGQRLVEAELHLFKLSPESLASSGHWSRRSADLTNSTSQASGHLNVPKVRLKDESRYQLRSNLLEVSIHQILAKRVDGEYPLRLLDIRRIDLSSSGWETFYVKRAVDDWLRDPKLNLGLVIKAKSMLEEPVRSGLIRFADLFEPAARNNQPKSSRTQSHTLTQTQTKTQRETQLQPTEFGLSHQPILVIYTAPDGSGQ